MRKRTLATIAYLLALVLVYLLRAAARSQGVPVPWLATYASLFVASLVVTPLLLIPLTKLNDRLLEWRRARGRDIEAEERHETESGVLSIKPVRPAEDESRTGKYPCA
jgi:hypothetical protein